MKLQYVATNEQTADVSTKPLSRVKLEYFRDKLRVVPRKRSDEFSEADVTVLP